MGILNDPRPIGDSGIDISAEAQAMMAKFPKPPTFSSDAEIEALTHDQAIAVMRHVRRTLLDHLIGQESHEHMSDDCGDYLMSATDGWTYMMRAWDLGDGDYLEAIKAYLRAGPADDDYPLGACDGEARYDFLSEDLLDSRYDRD